MERVHGTDNVGVAYTQHNPGSSPYFARCWGPISELSGYAPWVKTLDKQAPGFEADKTMQLVSDWLTWFGSDLKGICAADDCSQALGIFEALEKVGRDDVVVVAAGNSKVEAAFFYKYFLLQSASGIYMTGKQRCLAVIGGKQPDRVPVFPLTMFLPADRYGVPYKEYATNGSAMAQAQVLMTETFDVDAVTGCSDAYRVSADLGAQMAYPENGTPFAEEPLIKSEADFQKLGKPDTSVKSSRMRDRTDSVAEMVRAVGEERLVVGWIDMPFAEACSICGVSRFMLMLYDNPSLAHRILEFLTGVVIDFAAMQLETGAPMIGAGDASASLISLEMYRKFALPYEKRVAEAVHARGGLIKLHVCGNVGDFLPDMAEGGFDLINVDHLVPFEKAVEVFGAAGIAYKGNLHPAKDFVYAEPSYCAARARECIDRAQGTRYILSGGCEIPPDTSDEVFRAFCDVPKNGFHGSA